MVQSIRISDDLGSEDYAFEDCVPLLEARQLARSFLAIQKGNLKGFTFTPNQASEFYKEGSGR